MSLCEFSDVSLEANSELKPKFQMRITLAGDYVSDKEKDNNENDRDEEQDVDLSVDNVPTKLKNGKLMIQKVKSFSAYS